MAVRAVMSSEVRDSMRASFADMKLEVHVAGEVTEGDDWDERGRRSAVLYLDSYGCTRENFSDVTKNNEEIGELLNPPEFCVSNLTQVNTIFFPVVAK